MLPSSSSSEPSSTVAQPIITKLSYTSLNISVDNFALLRASLACMHAKVLNTIKRKDIGDRTKIDIIFNLLMLWVDVVLLVVVVSARGRHLLLLLMLWVQMVVVVVIEKEMYFFLILYVFCFLNDP